MKMLKKILVLSLVASATLLASADINDIKKLKMFDKPNISINSFLEHESTYQVKGTVSDEQRTSPFEAFITKDYKEVIFGKGFNIQTEKPLVIPIDIDLMRKTAEYTIGEGVDEYFIFTDPECQYCQNLEKAIPQIAKHAKVHVFLFPLSRHKDAKVMSYYIMSQKDDTLRAEAMHKIANGGKEFKDAKLSQNDIEKYDVDLKAQLDFANTMGVSSTPTIFSVNGNKVEYPELMQKYNIAEPVDMGGIEFLKKSNLEISLNDNNKDPLYVFTTVSELNKLKAIESKYAKEKSIRVFLKLDNALKDLNPLKAIYMQTDNATRVKLIKDLMSEKEIDNTLLDAAKNLSKDEETKFLPVSYVMQKMRLKADGSLIIVDSKGNVVE
ncbi:MAG: thioredoxin fold domain-containing protein [Sulfurimonas sp.]|jgi:thiol:disulfide interchange protein DsbC